MADTSPITHVLYKNSPLDKLSGLVVTGIMLLGVYMFFDEFMADMEKDSGFYKLFGIVLVIAVPFILYLLYLTFKNTCFVLHRDTRIWTIRDGLSVFAKKSSGRFSELKKIWVEISYSDGHVIVQILIEKDDKEQLEVFLGRMKIKLFLKQLKSHP